MVDRQDLARPAPELSEDGIPAGWGTTVAEQLGDPGYVDHEGA